jgi:hypothetical protein
MMASMKTFTVLLFAALLSPCAHAQEWVGDWLQGVSATQAEQPHWVTPVVTVTPRLEQEIRYDFVHQVTPTGDITNIGNGKGLELIPTHNTELIFNIPPYLIHSNPAVADGFGDVSFLLKYRILSRNEHSGNYILTAFVGGSIPTGSHKNGSASAIVTPTIAFGKGWHKFSVQSTLGTGLPVDDIAEIGRTLISNTAFQLHAARFLWPEVEINATSWFGGVRDGKTQNFVTPGVVVGRFPLHNRIGLTLGAGFQIATSEFYQYNHAFVGTIRMPF